MALEAGNTPAETTNRDDLPVTPLSEPADSAPPPLADETPVADATPVAGVADGPLLPDAADLRANWQRVQAAFVDNPRASVTEAADLVEHVAQALAGALQQRQRTLREQWDDGERSGDGDTAGDTERLRRTLQRYRAVFNQICGV
ncbi:MAG TPA: hypothetical protein VH372_13180 [Actinospica sp.]|jgi:hypothetical protein|nr:hypothetical protein [Actinospica sp.]